jgi:hypothetical protein
MKIFIIITISFLEIAATIGSNIINMIFIYFDLVLTFTNSSY